MNSALAWEKKVVETARSCLGTFKVDGERVDAPVIARAVELLKQVYRSHG